MRVCERAGCGHGLEAHFGIKSGPRPCLVDGCGCDGYQPKFWSCEDGSETLDATDLGEAIGDYLDQLDELPETLRVVGYEPVVAALPGNVDAAEYVFEQLDDVYGGENPTEPTDAMQRLARKFEADMLALYEPWACEEVCAVTISVRDWVATNDPERLDQIR